MKHKNKIIIIVIILLITITSISFAYISVSDKQTTANTFTSGCLDVTINSEGTSLSLTNTVPTTDEDGMESTPYTFTIKNNCSTSTNYQISLENLNQTTNTLSSEYIKTSIVNVTDEVTKKTTLINYTSTSTTLTGAYEGYKLYTGTIEASEEISFELREWIDYQATKEEAASKTYTSKIVVTANPEIETSVCDTYNADTALGTLAVSNCVPDFSLSSEAAAAYGVCTYNNNSVIHIFGVSEEYCSTIYKFCNDDSTCGYYDAVVGIFYSYVGEATWDEETSTCTYNGITLTYVGGSTITSKENCKEIYSPYNDSSVYFSGIKNVGAGDWESMPKPEAIGLYAAEDDDGTSYYYRGAVENNYVKFAGFYWRIIRINGDGSIRLIYDGTTARSNGTASGDTQIGSSAFNDTYDSIDFVGFMYTIGSVRGNTTSSTIKGVLDTWYANNLASYSSYIDTDAGFCGDRQTYGNREGTLEGTSWTAASIRIADHKPSFKCLDSRDLYTVSSSGKGNKALTYPIGLITSDEALYAGVGGYGVGNKTFYLYTGNYYWTMSPNYSNLGIYIAPFGGFEDGPDVVTNSYGVRPIINLRSDLIFTGSGTIDSPYVIS